MKRLILALDGITKPAAERLEKIPDVQFLVLKDATREEKLKAVAEARIIMVRSETKVDVELLAAARVLELVVRAGIGLDNVDVTEATRRGVIVMNTPVGNTVTTAEHAIAMMMSLVRRIPQATASMKKGLWEKKAFQGTEIYQKTLGVLGLGNIGKVVASRALGLGMRVVAYDPFVTDEKAREMGVEKVELDSLYLRSDIITIHVPLLDQTRNLVNASAFERMKKGVFLVHCARGGIVDEAALLQALDTDRVAGAALDVFETEPPAKDSKLVQHPKVICTPHLGASTAEAQLAVNLEAADQIEDYVVRGNVGNAVNYPNMSQSRYRLLGPVMSLAERMGIFLGQWIFGDGKRAKEVALMVQGVGQEDRSVLTLSFLKGFLTPVFGSDRVNFVNAKTLALSRDLQVLESSGDVTSHYSQLLYARVTVDGGEQLELKGTLFGTQEPRFVEFNGFKTDAYPEGWVLVTMNEDKPNMIGKIGSCLGAGKVNIASMHLGRRPKENRAFAMTNLDNEVPTKVLEDLRKIDGIEFVKLLHIEGSLQ